MRSKENLARFLPWSESDPLTEGGSWWREKRDGFCEACETAWKKAWGWAESSFMSATNIAVAWEWQQEAKSLVFCCPISGPQSFAQSGKHLDIAFDGSQTPTGAAINIRINASVFQVCICCLFQKDPDAKILPECHLRWDWRPSDKLSAHKLINHENIVKAGMARSIGLERTVKYFFATLACFHADSQSHFRKVLWRNYECGVKKLFRISWILLVEPSDILTISRLKL